MISLLEHDGENASKLENTLQDIIQENFPNLARQANREIQEIQRTPQRYSSRRATSRHMIVRFTRVEMKEKNAKKEKKPEISQQKPYKPEESGGSIFNILKEKNFPPRISYLAKLSFISEGEIKSFMDKQLLRDFITTRLGL